MERFNQTWESKLSASQRKKKKRKKYPNVFFKNEIVKLFNNIEDPKLMIGTFLAFFCALRISELCELKWQDIDLENKRLKVVNGKNYKDGFVPISSICIQILKKWKLMNPEEEYFLPSDQNNKKHIQTCSLRKSYKLALKKAGLHIPTEKNSAGFQQYQYKFHTLRHSRCTHLLNNGVPIQKVQYFMRHDKIETTMTYTWILNTELNQMVEEVDKKTIHQEFLTDNTTIIQPTNNDPVEIARKRFAFGEISSREFKKIIEVLQTPFSV